MLGLLPFQGVVCLLNQYHRALPWAKSKLCPFRAQADKTIFRKAQQAEAIHRTHVIVTQNAYDGFRKQVLQDCEAISAPRHKRNGILRKKFALLSRKKLFPKVFLKKTRKNLVVSRKVTTFASQFRNHSTDALRTKFWRDGRVVDCIGLENRRTERYRGFESLSLR